MFSVKNYALSVYEKDEQEAGISSIYGDDGSAVFAVYVRCKDGFEELFAREFFNLKNALEFANSQFATWQFIDRVAEHQKEKAESSGHACGGCENHKH